ncbi:hypothetical protein [Campylobacter hominis]|uniref:hypothetical protein n=1 Tax=Campylobacter hominis TaxID=76517 RepID=UPI00248BACEB|nr:hypothetical protein [Campylobacter hominis]
MRKIQVFLFILMLSTNFLNAEKYDYRNAKPENMKVEFIKYVYDCKINNKNTYEIFYSPEFNFLFDLISVTTVDGYDPMYPIDEILESVDEVKITQLDNDYISVKFNDTKLILKVICSYDINKNNADDEYYGLKIIDGCWIDDIFEFKDNENNPSSFKREIFDVLKNNVDLTKFLDIFTIKK